ncbi:MAG: methyltransferase domain-containing protein [Candidatus Dojkabacteria bacterium]
MVKKDFVPGPYMNRAENNGIINKTVTASGVLSRVEGVEPNEVTYKFSVDPAEGEDSKAGPLAILEDSEGNWTIVKDQYVAFILESIPGATFRAYGEENPVVVYSGDAVAGIFMPYANAGVVLASRGESGKKGRLRAVGRQKTIPMVSREQIIASLALILKRWKNHPDITVVDSISELPAGLRRQAIMAGAITGAFYNDTVYLVADGIGSIDEAYQTILHEVIAHWGLRQTFGGGFDSFLGRLYADIDKTRLQPIAEQYGLDLSKRSDQLVCMEEYLALLAEKGEKPSVWKRFIAWVRAWLIDKGFKLKVTQNDVDVLIASALGKARRYVQDGKGYAVEGFVGGEPLLRSVESIQRANRTSRGYGAVGSKAITPRYVESIASPSDKILDFGAGKGAVHAADLRENGLNVTAYDFGSNVRDGIHDPDALSREYDIVYASNVLNVQSGKEDLIETLEEIASAVRTGGRAVFNFPGSPRFLDMDAVGLAGEIRKVFGNAPVRVGGTKAAPLFEVVKNGKGQKAVFRKAEAQTDEPLDTKSLFPEVQTRMEKARGLGKQGSVKDRALAKLEETWHSWRRHFPQLDPAKHGKFINILRLFEAVPNYSKTRARDNIKDILGKMNDREYDVFSFNVILEDLMKDLDSGLLDPENLKDGETLPFGYTSRAQVEQDLAHFKAQASKNKAVADALERRSEYVRQMREDLVHHGLLDKSKLNDPAYFHHQVLEMWALRKWTGSGVGTKDVRTHKKGWQIARTGSLRDYNTEYIESEFEVLAQGIAQIETKKTMDRIDREANIIKSLRGRARAWNESRALEIFEEKGLVEIVESQETGEIKRVTPFTPLEKQIAVGFSRLHEMASEGILEGNDEFSDVIDSLAEEGENSRVFGYLAWLLKNDAPGAMEAARIFKGIKGKEALIKSTLGDQLKTFRDLIPEGYAEWKPEPGSAWYLTNSITDKVLDQIRSGERSFDDQETRKILARGVDAVWVVPEELAATLSDFRAYKDEGPLGKASQFLISSWKQWVLINPFRVFKYNLNNMSGDFDICWAYDPKIIKNYMWKAGKDLLKYVRNQDLSPELKEELDTAFRKDVLGSGMTVHDITDITEHMALDGYLDVMAGRKVNAISRFWNTSKKYTTYRENILRLASYRYFKDRLAKGEKAYGASNRDIVDSIRNRDDRAALLARELVGDYGNLTVSGQWLRTKMIPFYSWMEINAPRYVRMFHNLPIEGEGRGNLAEALTMKTARKAVGLSAKAATLYAMIIIWNMTMARLLCGGDDPEKELSDFERRQLHLILGRREDGSIISIRMQGALSDALAWFGLENMPGDVADLATGRKTGIEQAKEMAAAAPSRIVNASHPFIKLAAEELTGYSTFPDIFHPRPIRDKLEHLARMFSLDRPYKHLTGKPTRGDWAAGEFWEDVVNLVGYSSDPGESAYFDTRSRARSFMERKGVNPGYFHADSNSKSAALYNYKRALQYGDLDVAKKFLDKYMELGGSRKGLKISVRLASPEAWVPKKYRAEFRNSLMKSDLEKYNRAMKWYREVYGGQ